MTRRFSNCLNLLHKSEPRMRKKDRRRVLGDRILIDTVSFIDSQGVYWIGSVFLK